MLFFFLSHTLHISGVFCFLLTAGFILFLCCILVSESSIHLKYGPSQFTILSHYCLLHILWITTPSHPVSFCLHGFAIISVVIVFGNSISILDTFLYQLLDSFTSCYLLLALHSHVYALDFVIINNQHSPEPDFEYNTLWPSPTIDSFTLHLYPNSSCNALPFFFSVNMFKNTFKEPISYFTIQETYYFPCSPSFQKSLDFNTLYTDHLK